MPSTGINEWYVVYVHGRSVEYGRLRIGFHSFRRNSESEIPGWAKSEVSLVKELGIVSGKKDNKFVLQDTATRAEAVTMIINLIQVKK